MLLPVTVARAVNSLNKAQRRAVLCADNSVALAGPGSGKTRVLVTKAAYLASTAVQPPQRVACITYANQAADEMRRRLQSLGSDVAARVSVSTVHGFALAEVVRPFSFITGFAPYGTGAVVSEEERRYLRIDAYQRAGLAEDPKWSESRDTSCRREIFAGGDLARFDPLVVQAAIEYDAILDAEGRLDFESMVGRALQIVKGSRAVRDILVYRFPWLLVDEYQDMGPVLHGIVSSLRSAGSRAFAVGDPDQSILGFTGSDPKYLIELSGKSQIFPLTTNYRSGKAIVAASSAMLGGGRNYDVPDGASEGVIDLRLVSGGLSEHAEAVAGVVQELLEGGVEPGEIAVLYPRNRRRVPLRDWLHSAMAATDAPLLAERAEPWPTGSVVRFLQRAAGWQIGYGEFVPGRRISVTFEELLWDYMNLRWGSGYRSQLRVAARDALWKAIGFRASADVRLVDWLPKVESELHLRRVLKGNASAEELASLRQLRAHRFADASLGEFSGESSAVKKVRLTTFYSSKGREWEYVIIPYMQEAIIPGWPLDYGKPYPPSAIYVSEERRLFYVGMTRAKIAVILLYSGDLDGQLWTAYRSPSRFLANLSQD